MVLVVHNRKRTTRVGGFPIAEKPVLDLVKLFYSLQLYSEGGRAGSFTLIRAWEATSPNSLPWDKVRASQTSHPLGFLEDHSDRWQVKPLPVWPMWVSIRALGQSGCPGESLRQLYRAQWHKAEELLSKAPGVRYLSPNHSLPTFKFLGENSAVPALVWREHHQLWPGADSP